MLTREDVLEKAKESHVKFLRMQFTDTFGVLKNIAVTSEDLAGVLSGRISFDSSVVDGVTNHHEQDITLLPDPSTFVVFPWRPREGAVARFICDVFDAAGSPYSGCSRNVLKKVLSEAAQMRIKIYVGAEVQFYLFCTDDRGNPTTNAHDCAGFCDLTPVDSGENARRDIVLTLEEMGFDIGFSHHEAGPGQHEIALKPDNALAIADKLVTFKFIVRTIAQRHGLHASLMPKPLNGAPGSALHLHLFPHREDNCPALDTEQPLPLERELGHFIGGVLAHTRANTAITNPLINSYKRLVTGDMTPMQIAWSEGSRDSVLRVAAHHDRKIRVEVRNPDPACNPYLALAVILKAGLHGMQRQLQPPPPLAENTLRIDENQNRGFRVECLPRTLAEALRELASDQLTRDTLGEYIYRRFAMAKGKEWERFQAFVHPWELQEYFSFF
ncbi:glutamine synthetase family protein [Pelotomaculum sp. PtaB.Bin117]|uniref:glutamine synthetase family protein n=1 Tax=Pelotomaculum sp. PtaB.Bin117 TaxID=1811694 RepID=UPI0009C635D7|nr:glutamine synthetase family protein [Pelotomaculum sp. PtaB.Bin117]OPX90975.1 MAG: Glutamine synthetase [Pelotomaculum sp. PtaB.Bin117]